jgi:hypothetical protein
MYKKIFLILIVVLLISTPIYAETLNWQPVNYSSPDLIKESGLTVEEFNDLTQAEWVDLFNDKEKVNFAFSATDSEGNDITNSINPNLSINVEGLNNNQTVQFTPIGTENNSNLNYDTQTKINNTILEYSKVIYVDINGGNDLIGNGSKEQPFKTLDKAISVVSANNNEAIYLENGNYTVQNSLSLFSKNEVHYFGNKSTITVQNAVGIDRDISNISFYQMVLQPGNSFGESRALFDLNLNYNEHNISFKFINSVFQDPFNVLPKGTRHNSYIIGDSSRNMEHNYNVLFANSISLDNPIMTVWADKLEGGYQPNVTIKNSATTETSIDSPNNEIGNYGHDILIKENNAESVTFNSNYNITSGNFFGVGIYEGEFAW